MHRPGNTVGSTRTYPDLPLKSLRNLERPYPDPICPYPDLPGPKTLCIAQSNLHFIHRDERADIVVGATPHVRPIGSGIAGSPC